jgi:hypothetical protein
VRVREFREQRGPVGSVNGPDLEVRAEGIDGGGRKFFSDQYNWLRH